MQTTIETISQLERRMTFGLPKDGLESEVKKRLNRLAKTVKMAGFRPGKVPFKMVEAQYGAAVYNDVLKDQVQKAFNDAVQENKLRLAGAPQVTPKPAEGSDADQNELVFQAQFEIYPDVKLADMKDVELVSPEVDITDADIDRTLETLRKQRAKFDPVDRASAEGDRVMCDYEATIDGQPFDGGTGHDLPVVVGAKSMLPEFEAAIENVSKGDVKEFDVAFPENYHGRDVAGKTAQFKVTIKNVLAPTLPEVNEDFAKSLGIEDGSVETLRTEVRKNLELQLKHRLENLVKEQVMDAILTGVDTKVPKVMINDEMQRLAGQFAENLKRQGMSENDIRLSPEMFRDSAERNVKLSLALGETVQQNSLQPQEHEIRALLQEMAQTYDDPETVVRWHFERPERLNRFSLLAAERNLVQWAQKTAKVTAKPMSLEEVMAPTLSFVKAKEEAATEEKKAEDKAE